MILITTSGTVASIKSPQPCRKLHLRASSNCCAFSRPCVF
ncbi:hypothetical protein KP509_37G046600 [Ceratopteris richardii]|uniref:Uncharacterized protein n=1 Tax=Ceratopteris richardii TaxID=49495 RepID=A0A8T2Q7G1_CERRI|nr:hypothetical protein KP509_37G046600 [Ceratopteris richardii]